MRAQLFAVLSVLAALGGCAKKPADEHREKGLAAFRRSDFGDAGVELKASLELEPQQDQALYEKAAFSFMKAGATDEAAALLEKTVALRASEEDKLAVLRNIAGMYMQAGNQAKAEHYFQQAVTLKADDTQSLAWLAELAAQRGGARSNDATPEPGELEKALGYYEKLIALSPGDPAPYTNKRIALVKYQRHFQEQAKSALQDAEDNKADKEVQSDFLEQAKKHQAKVAELDGVIAETTKKLSEALKAKKR